MYSEIAITVRTHLSSIVLVGIIIMYIYIFFRLLQLCINGIMSLFTLTKIISTAET